MKYIALLLFTSTAWAEGANMNDPNLTMPPTDKFEATAQLETCCNFKHVTTQYCTSTPGQNGCILPAGYSQNNATDASKTSK